MSNQGASIPGGVQAGSTPVVSGGGGGGGVASVVGNAPITSTGGANPHIGITAASGAAAGSMSAADKTKLDGITAGAAVASVTGADIINVTAGSTPVVSTKKTGSTAGRARIPILIEKKSLVAAGSYTSPTWTAGQYEEIIIYFNGTASAFLFMGFQANADSGLHYTDLANNVNSGSAPDSVASGTNGYARVGVTVAGGIKFFNEIHFFPLTDGNERAGHATSTTVGPGAVTTMLLRVTGFGWTDKVTDVTFITLVSSTAATLTGTVEVWGVEA